MEKYVQEFGEPKIEDSELEENIADLVLEKRKLNSSHTDEIIKNIKINKQLVYLRLHNIPNKIVDSMKTIYEN